MQDSQSPLSESGTSPPRRLSLVHVKVVPGRTAATGVGLDADGNEVSFAADWRHALVLAEALAAGESVEVLEDWQIIAWRRS